jgi:hypothetical protein
MVMDRFNQHTPLSHDTSQVLFSNDNGVATETDRVFKSCYFGQVVRQH